MQAVRERDVGHHVSMSFDPAAVPSLQGLPVTRPGARDGLTLAEDLHQLAEERLFTGNRTHIITQQAQPGQTDSMQTRDLARAASAISEVRARGLCAPMPT